MTAVKMWCYWCTCVIMCFLECVTCIHRLIEHSHIERQNYVQAAVRWSRQVDNNSTSTVSTASTGAATSTSTGHPLLHAQFALTYWQGIVYVRRKLLCLTVSEFRCNTVVLHGVVRWYGLFAGLHKMPEMVIYRLFRVVWIVKQWLLAGTNNVGLIQLPQCPNNLPQLCVQYKN